MTPEEFPKRFAAAFAARDGAAIAGWLAGDAEVQTLTGAVAEDAAEAEAAFAAEFAGVFAAARLVTGRLRLHPIGPGAAVLHQRYVVIGAREDHGAELPRFGALMTAVLLKRAEGWRAVFLGFSPLAQ